MSNKLTVNIVNRMCLRIFLSIPSTLNKKLKKNWTTYI